MSDRHVALRGSVHRTFASGELEKPGGADPPRRDGIDRNAVDGDLTAGVLSAASSVVRKALESTILTIGCFTDEHKAAGAGRAEFLSAFCDRVEPMDAADANGKLEAFRGKCESDGFADTRSCAGEQCDAAFDS